MDNNFIVNIGRQLGSGGREIGEKLATRLGIDFYDKELIRLASQHSPLSSACVSLLSVTGLSLLRIA